MPSPNAEPTLLRRLAWFIGLWCLGVAAVLAIGGIIKLVL